MKSKRIIYYLCLLAGAVILIIAQDRVRENWPVLIVGFALLMVGLFGVNRGISGQKPELDPYRVQEEKEEESNENR